MWNHASWSRNVGYGKTAISEQNGYIGARGGGRRNLVHISVRRVCPIEGKKFVYRLLLESISHLISFEKLGGFGGGVSMRIARP